EKGYLQKDLSKYTRDRLLPAIMIWGKDIDLEKVKEPASKVWMGQGASPVCMMRTSWTDPNAIYLGFKAGSASVNHAHMDMGSFVMEWSGFRWASDFGMQEYESLESKGIQVFGRSQDAQRWTIFRLNNRAHNTLTIDDQLQQVKGYAKIDKYSDAENFSYAMSDLSTIYKDQLATIRRGAAIVDKKYVVVRDELVSTSKSSTTVRWTMLTGAEVEITGANTATLTKDGKKLYLRVDTPATIRMKTWSTAPTTSYDAANPGTTLVGFECDVPANTKEVLQVLLIPEAAGNVNFSKKLEQW
ncbi:MAG TPA: heparinase II/III family protein, partial [Bacteroidales bacterium]|nr:heparinase II/III family protein [Bacteroidales bacterium]